MRPLANPVIRGAIASWVCAAFLSALALSVSPHWHELVHPDAKAAQHECAVTLIGSGSYQQAAPRPLSQPLFPLFSFVSFRRCTPSGSPRPFSARAFSNTRRRRSPRHGL